MRAQVVFTLLIICSFGTIGAQNVAQNDDNIVLHEEFAGLLFDHLELGEPGLAITQSEKLTALIELNFTPRKGYVAGQILTYGELADVLVAVYSLQGKLPKDYKQEQAIELLVNEKILPKLTDPSEKILYNDTLDIVRKIPMGPNAIPKTVLLPRIPVEPPLSRVD